MKKLLLTGAMLASACSGKGEIIPTPSPEPQPPTTLQAINSAALAAPETTVPATTVPATTTTEPEPVPTVPPRRSTSTTSQYLREEATTRSSSAVLASIRACESGGNYSAVSPNGLYYGAYQFHHDTWASVGGSGNPAHASPAEQDMRAQMMIDAGRRGEWPNC